MKNGASTLPTSAFKGIDRRDTDIRCTAYLLSSATAP
jgi:hypothetical protein